MDNNTDNIIKQNDDFLNLLRFYKRIDKTDLGRILQLSMPTVYKSIKDLSDINAIVKLNSDICINKYYGILAGVSIGASLCKIVFLGYDFRQLDFDTFTEYKMYLCNMLKEYLEEDELLNMCISDRSRNYIFFKTPKSFPELKDILNILFGCIKEWISSKKLNVISIGISCTGIINSHTQTILDAHNLSYLRNRTLNSLIYPDKQNFFVENNINICLVQNSSASVIAEKIYLNFTDSPYKNKKNIIAIYLGMGIGAGIYLNELYEGTNGYAGEIGHTRAPDCKSEEDKERIDNLAKEGKVDKCCSCTSESRNCYDYKIRTYVFEKTAEEFCDMSANDMRNYLKTKPEKLKLLGEYFGEMVNTFTNLFNIDLVIFTGKIYKSMDLIMNYIVSMQDENPLEFNRNDCEIITSSYGSLSPSLGAAIYAYNQKYDIPFSWNC